MKLYNAKTHRRKNAQLIFSLLITAGLLWSTLALAAPPPPEPELYDIPAFTRDTAAFTRAAALLNPQPHAPLPAPAPPVTLPATVWRIGITADGLYALDYATLLAAGVPVTTARPSDLHLFWRGQTVAMDALGTADASFDPGDALIFYGEKFHGSRQDEKYTDENVYWLTVDADTPGLRMTTRDVTPDSNPTGVCTGTVLTEQNLVYWGRWSATPGTETTWFWERISQPLSGEITRTYPLTLSAPLNTAHAATLVVAVAARNENTSITPDHHLRLTLNSTSLGEVYWEGKVGHIITATVPAAALLDGLNELHVTLIADTAHQDIYFDRATLTYRRAANADCTAAQEGTATYTLTAPPTARLYDVSAPLRPVALINYAHADTTLTFSDNAPARTHYRAAVPQTASLTRYQPDLDLITPTVGADEIIVAPRDFFPALQPLVTQRQAQGLRVRLVDVADVYPLFNSGIYHPEAIRALVAHAYTSWPGPAPAYLLLVGDGNFNLKGYHPDKYGLHVPSLIPPYLDFADPYQGEVPLDSRFGDVAGDSLPEVVVGRIPAETAADVAAVVAKILAYEAAPVAEWQLRALLVADNVPDTAGDFRAVLERLITAIITPNLQVERLYLNDYCGAPTNPAQPCPSGTRALTETWSAGAGLVTYSGHASINRWAHEKFLRTAHIATFTPTTQLPFVMSLDCLDGNWMFPPAYPGLDDTRSIAEQLLLTPERGAIAALAPAGLSYTWDGENIARAVYRAMLQDGEFRIAALSQIARAASRTHLRQVYTLFGDPAMVLPFADELTLTSATSASTPITLTAGRPVSITAIFAPQLHTRFGQTLPLTPTAWTADAGTFDADGYYIAPVTATVAHVTAHFGAASTTVPVTVVAGPPVTVTVAPNPVQLAPGAQVQMTATARDTYLNPTPSTGTITWTRDIGNITPSGLFTAPTWEDTGRITATLTLSQSSQTLVLRNFAAVAVQTLAQVYLPLVMRQ